MTDTVPISSTDGPTDAKIAELKKEKTTLATHIKYCAYLLLVGGIIGFLQSVYCYLSAKKWAKFIVEHKKLPWGHKHQAVHHEVIHDSEPHYMTRDEFLLTDLLSNIGMISIFFYVCVLVTGCVSKKIAKWQSRWCTKWLMKKIILAFVFAFLAYIFSKKIGREFKDIFMNLADQETQEMMAEKSKKKLGVCPFTLMFFIIKAFNIYKVHSLSNVLEKIHILEEHKKEQEKKDKIIEAAQQKNY